MKLEKNIPSIYCFPQGIGDFLHVLDRFLLGHLEKDYNDKDIFILQYDQQKIILNFLIKKKTNVFLTTDIKKKPLILFKLIFKIIKKKFKLLIIEPNISKKKSLFLSLITRYQQRYTSLDKDLKFTKLNKVTNYDIIYNHIHLSKNKRSLSDYFVKSKNSNQKFNIGISAGSGELEKHKRWPKIYFSDLINILLKYDNNAHIHLYGSDREYKLNKDIYDKVDNKYKHQVLIFKDFDIIKSLNSIKNLDLFIANDNGLSHAAHLMNVRTIAIYGPTDEKDHGTFENRHIVKKNIECAPCYHKMRFGCGNELCLKTLSPEFVFNKFMNVLNS
tara:strand:- start:7125 stop:8114 length:990 start_codon:yes stop_codon:yes gene_type:complete